jgi:transcriptional regulator GlxA family with amidase domain
MNRIPKLNGSGAEASDRNIEQCLVYILTHLNERLTLAQLARLANLSPARFAARFKQKTGVSPIRFLIRLRIHQADQLLQAGNMSISGVARTLGYRDPSFFSRQFKLYKGTAPKNYRRPGFNMIAPIPADILLSGRTRVLNGFVLPAAG